MLRSVMARLGCSESHSSPSFSCKRSQDAVSHPYSFIGEMSFLEKKYYH